MLSASSSPVSPCLWISPENAFHAHFSVCKTGAEILSLSTSQYCWEVKENNLQIKILEIDYFNKILEDFLKKPIIFHTITSRHSLEIYHSQVAFINKK